MRYARGSVVFSAEGDIPLLRQVRNARFVSHDQLFLLLHYEAAVTCRSTFNWRIQRLLKTRCIQRLESFSHQGSAVYSITNDGLRELDGRGEFAIALHSGTRNMPDRSQSCHALELNSIRLALMRTAALVQWKSEIEIASTNMISASPYQKDYDAVVKVWIEDEIREFALEYERSLKPAREYAKIRDALAAEHKIPCVVYLTASADLMVALLYQLTPCSKPIAFACAQQFVATGISTAVALGVGDETLSLAEFLRYSHPLYIRAGLGN